MSVFLIQMLNRHKVATSVKTETEFRALRDSETNIENLNAARKGDKNAKLRLVQFCYTGIFPEGSAIKDCMFPSDQFVLDIDNPEEYERIHSVLINDPKRYGVLMMERSVGQGGHVVFRREKGKTILESQIAKARELDCEIDTTNHAVNGVYFATSGDMFDLDYIHPDLFASNVTMEEAKVEAEILEARVANGLEDVPQEARAQKHYRPSQTPATNSCYSEKTSENLSEKSSDSSSDNSSDQTVSQYPMDYLGIPYSEIIDKWWEIHYDGKRPIQSNRNSLTYELACNLRHICGFDAGHLDAVIPCYDDFSEAEKMKCINSALNARMTAIPKKLEEVLIAVRGDNTDNEDFVHGMDDLMGNNDRYYYDIFPKEALKQGIADAVNSVAPELIMPAIFTSTPFIGGLATGVDVIFRKKPTKLNISSYIVGISGSGKGSMDDIADAWLTDLKEEARIVYEKEQQWRKKKEKLGSTKEEQPERPDLPMRFISLNNTIPNIAKRIANVKGKHCISYASEIDSYLNKWRGSICEYSSMKRQSYDGSSYSRDARGAESVSVYIDHLYWNEVACGTPDALYRLINNYTDGLLSRIAIARTPDNTFAPLSEEAYVMSDKQRERIIQVARLLELMHGTVKLPKLEAHAMQWVENIRLESIKNNDAAFAEARKRDWVTAFRMTVCLLLCSVCDNLISKNGGFEKAKEMLLADPELWKERLQKCQSDEMMKAYDIIADSLIENDMYFFRDRLETAYNSKSYNGNGNERQRRGRNDNIFARLGNTFTAEQAMQQTRAVKGDSVTKNAVTCMLRNWINQGLIVDNHNETYTKLHT